MPGPDKNNSRKLYDALSEDYEMGSYEDFERDIQDDAKRRKLYDTVYEDYDLPSYDEFSRQLGVGGVGVVSYDGSDANGVVDDMRSRQEAAADRRRQNSFFGKTGSFLNRQLESIPSAAVPQTTDADNGSGVKAPAVAGGSDGNNVNNGNTSASSVPAEVDAQTQPTVDTADDHKVTDSLRLDSSGALLPQGIQGKGMFDLSEYDNQSWLINGQQFNSTAEARKYVEEHPEIRYNFNADGQHFKSFDELVQYVKEKSKAAFDEMKPKSGEFLTEQGREMAAEAEGESSEYAVNNGVQENMGASSAAGDASSDDEKTRISTKRYKAGTPESQREATELAVGARKAYEYAIGITTAPNAASDDMYSTALDYITSGVAEEQDKERRKMRTEYDKLHYGDFVKGHADVFFKALDEANVRGRNAMIDAAINTPYDPIDYGTIGKEFNAYVASRRETDPAKVADDVISTLDRHGDLTTYLIGRMGLKANEVPKDYNPVSGGGGGDTLTGAEMNALTQLMYKEHGEIAEKLQQEIYDYYKSRSVPENDIQYILESAFYDNFMSSLIRAMAHRAAGDSGLRDQLRQMAFSEYGDKAGFFTNAAATTAPFAVDIIGGGFLLASKAGQGATNLVTNVLTKGGTKRLIARGATKEAAKEAAGGVAKRWLATEHPYWNMALNAFGSGVNFATFEAQNELVRQIDEGKFSLGGLLGKGAKGFLLGNATGFAGGFFGKMGENMRGWQKLGVDLGGFGSEVGIFAASDAAMQALEGEDVNWGKAFGRSLAMVTGFKAVGGVMNPKAIYQRYAGVKDLDMKLTDSDKTSLSGLGYDFSTKEGLNKAIGELVPVENTNADGTKTVDRSNYDRVMQDNSGNVDILTKRKVNRLLTGSDLIHWTGGKDYYPFNAWRTENEDGTITIQTFDADGNINGIAEYRSSWSAAKDYRDVLDMCRFYNLNGIRSFLGNAGADVTIERDAFERTRKQFADEDVSELEALLSLKKPQEEWTNRDREILDAHLKNVHDVFGEQLKDYQEKQAAAAYDGATMYEETKRAAQEPVTQLLTGGEGGEGGGVPPVEGDGPAELSPADKARADYEQLMADVENRKRAAEAGVREVFGDDVIDYVTQGEGAAGFDPIFLLRQALVSGESPENIRKITDYINAWYAEKGMKDGVNDAVRSEIEQANAEIDGAANRQSGRVLGAVMKVDDRRVFVVDGEVVLNDDGTIDREKSSESLIVKDAATGKVEVVDPRDVLEAVDGGDATELKEARRKEIEAGAEGLPVPDATDNGGLHESGQDDVTENAGEQPTGSGESEDAMPMIGDGEDAEPDFMQTTPERGFRFIYDESGWDQEEGDAFVEANLAEAKKQLNAASKKKPKMGTSMSKYNKEKRDYEGKVQSAQNVVDYWEGVKQARDQRAGEEQRKRADEEARLQEEERQRIEQAKLEEQRRQEEEQRKQQEAEELGSHTVGKEIRDRWTGAPKVEGNADELTLADGTRIAGRYVLVESGAATPSHNAGGGFVKNAGFPVDENGGTVNDRDYERDTRAQAITREMGRTYDGRALQSVPVVSRDGVVLSGNGRTMAGEIAAADGTDGAYIENLSKYGGKFGFTPEQVAGMQHPRVVFVPDEALPYDAETFARFNAQEMKGQNKTETAVKLGKIVPDDVYNRVIRGINGFESISDFFSDDKATAEVVNELRGAGVINEMQYGEMFDGGKLSSSGRELVENVLIGKAFESNPDAVRMLTEYPAMRQKAVGALTAIGNNRRLGEDYTLEKEIGQAIELAYRALKSGAYKHGDKVSDFARQQNLFEFDEGATVADYQNMMVMLLADVLNGKEVNKLRNVLEIYNAHAAESAAGQMDMFSDGAVRTREDILNDVYNLLGYGTRKEIEQQRSGARETVRAQLDGASPGKPSGGDEGAEPSGTAGAVGSGSGSEGGLTLTGDEGSASPAIDAGHEAPPTSAVENQTGSATQGGTEPPKTAANMKADGLTESEPQPAEKGYTVEQTTYTNKKGKTSDVWLVKFGNELTKEQLSAGKELAKETLPGRKTSKGWWDAKQGGFLMRSEDAANEIGEKLGNADTVKDAQPLGLKDMQDAGEKGVGGKVVPGSDIDGTGTEPVVPADVDKQPQPNYDYDKEDDVYDKTLTGLRNVLNDRKRGAIPNIKGIEIVIRDLRKRAKTIEDGMATAAGETIPQAFDALANLNGKRRAYEQFLSDIRKKMAETERDDALAAHGVKLGDVVMYKGKEATIHDADARQVTLDVGLAPVLYEVTDWENVELPKPSEPTGPSEPVSGREEPSGGGPGGETPGAGETGGRKSKSKWVDDEDADRFEELRQRLRKKMGGQMNMGVDPEIFAIGAEMAYYMIKHGLHKFADFAREMIDAVGDEIRPYLKSLYEGARNFPETEEYIDKMTPYDEVREFDVKNFDKKGAKDIVGTAEHVVLEEQAAKGAETAEAKLKERRNEERRDKENGVVRASDGTPLRKAVEADFDGDRPLVYVNGEPKHVMMVMRQGEQTSGATFSAPVIGNIYTTDGKEHKLDELMVADDKVITETVDRYRNTIVDRMKEDPVVINTVNKNNETTYIPELSFIVKSDYLYGSLGDIDNPEYLSFIKAIDKDVDGFVSGTVDAVVDAVKNNGKMPAEPAPAEKADEGKKTGEKVLKSENKSVTSQKEGEDAPSRSGGVQLDLFGNPVGGAEESSKKNNKTLNKEKENGKNADIQTGSTSSGRGRHEQKPDGALGGSSGNEAERADRRGVGRSDASHPGTDQERGGGLPGIHQERERLEGEGRKTVVRNSNNNYEERGKEYAPKDVDRRIDANIAAIELMQKLQSEGRVATPKEKEVLRKFSGWGGLGKAFDQSGWRENEISKRLRGLLGDEAYDQAVMSRNSSFYTPAAEIDALWDIARALGFKGGNVLEGSAGIGKIIGHMPKDMSERSNIHAVEIDQTTGGILSLLYPDAKVDVQGFEQTRIPNGSVDLSITNVPFVSGLRVDDTTGDKDLSRRFHDIHDFCIAKNIRKLRDGGIGIFITTNGTLDNSQKLRDWVVGEGGADFIGAFRLNNTTFGGTGTTSDILVVRKRVNGHKSPHAIDVSTVTGVRVSSYEDWRSGKKPVQVSMDYNKYFVEHPEMMGGEMGFNFEHGNTYRPTSKGLFPVKGVSQDERLAAFVESMKGKEEDKAALSPQQTEPLSDDTDSGVYESLGEGVKEGSMLIDKNDNLCIASYGRAVPLEVNKNKVKGHTKQDCFRSYSAIKDAVKAVLDYQTTHDDDKGLAPLLKNLNKVFDDFVNTYGHFHKNPAISFLKNDMDYSSVAALEDAKEYNDESGKRQVKYTKGDIFGRRVVEKETEPHPETVQDGVLASIYKHGRIDIPYISEQLGMDADAVKREIISSGLGFENPLSREVEVSYEYLSGNVREKLHQAEESNDNGQYDVNIKALRNVIPMDIPAHLIDFTLGSSWLDPKLYEDYVKDRTDISVKMKNVGGTWVVKAPEWGYNNEKNMTMGVRSEKFNKVVFGHELIIAALQNKSVRVDRTVKKWDGSKETEVDQEATQACASKIDEIRQDFKEWARDKMQNDAEMSEKVEKEYNERFNNYVPKTIPDSFVPAHFGGASHAVTLRPHQAKAAIRATTQPLMLAHEVGTGKTFTLITTAMEMRRLGTARKPMIVVQNATVGQFVSSAKFLYPNAKILTLEDTDRKVEGRKAFYAKIKYNDWDMIVIPQSTLDMIPDSEERQMAFVKDKIEEKMRVLEQMRDAGASRGEMSRAEKEIEKLHAELSELSGKAVEKRRSRDEKKEAVARQNAGVKAREMLDRHVDDVEDFDEMGIDAILIDEAHEYKHLGFATAMQRGVKGIDPSYSKKSQGVYLKCKSVMERTGGKNVVFATGTPISNTAAEIWTFMRYLMPEDTMKEYGIYYFDDFVRNFGNLSQMLEFTTSGKFKENNRFAGYVNLPELIRIWSGVSDTVLTDEASDLKSKIPEMEGDKATDLYLPQTRALRSVMRFVKEQLKKYDKMSGREKKENSHIPLTMYGIAKAAAVDVRLVVDNADDDPNSKTNEAVRQTLKTLEETASYKGTVAIFADNYQNKHTGFNLYEDIRGKLIEAGVPAAQIVVMKPGMSINKKLEIFDKVNAGEIRVIMGSTATLGTGVNIQERLHTLIHLDAPNRPMDYTQRNGRILRQGNIHRQMNIPVRVLRFGVEDSLDVTAYQRLKTKGAIADSVMHGKQMMSNNMDNRTMEEDEDVFGDTVAQLSGSEYALLKQQAEREVRKLESKERQHHADQTYIHNQIPRLEGQNRASEQRVAERERGLALIDERRKSSDVSITIGMKHFKDVDSMSDFVKDYNKKLNEEAERIRNSYMDEQAKRDLTVSVGGFDFKFTTMLSKETERVNGVLKTVVRRRMTYSCDELGLHDVPVERGQLRNGLSDIVDNVLSGDYFRERIDIARDIIARNNEQLSQLRAREGRVFEQADELRVARERLADYETKMKEELEQKEAKYADIDAEVEEATGVTAVDDEDEGDDLHFSDGEDVDDDAAEIETVNKQFNAELQQQIDGTLPSGHVYDMGMPSENLLSTGIPNLPIRLQASVLNRKSTDPYHIYSLSEVRDLVKLIQKPVAVFSFGDKDKAQNLMLGISQDVDDGRQFLFGIAMNPEVNGTRLNINSVRNVFPKNFHDWIHWINQGKMLRVDDKKTIQAIIDALRINPVDYISNDDLDRAANLVKDFDNPKLPSKNLSAAGKNSSVNEETDSRDEVRSAIEETAAGLGEDVEIVDDVNTLTHNNKKVEARMRKAKGIFDARTGKVRLVLPNLRTAEDAAVTVLHEVVGHKGLRELFGDDFDVFLDNVYNNVEEDIRERIDGLNKKKQTEKDRRDATEEYLSRLTEGKEYEELVKRGVWQKIKDWFMDMLRKVGVKLRRPLNDNDLRYILWRSHERMKERAARKSSKMGADPLTEARDTAMRDKLGIDGRRQEGEIINSDSSDLLIASPEQTAKNIEEISRLQQRYKGVPVHPVTRDAGIEGLMSQPWWDHDSYDDEDAEEALFEFYEGSFKTTLGVTLEGNAGFIIFADKKSDKYSLENTYFHESVHHYFRKMFANGEGRGICKRFFDANSDLGKSKKLIESIKKYYDESEWAEELFTFRLAGAMERGDFSKVIPFLNTEDIGLLDDILKSINYDREKECSERQSGRDSGSPDLRETGHGLHPLQNKGKVSRGDSDGNERVARESADEEESGLRFSDGDESADAEAARRELEGYDAGRMTFEDAITDGLTKLAAKNKEDKKLRVEAVMAIGGNLSKILQGMSRQREYDRQTVDDIVRLARTVIANGMFRNFTPYQVGRLLGMVKRATGREDITKEADKVVDMLMDCQLNELDSLLTKQLRVRGKKTDDRGVEIQGALDVKGQRMIDAMRSGIKLDADGLAERIADCRDRMGSDDDVTRQNAGQEFAGLLLAQEYTDNIAKSEAEEAGLYDEIRKADEERRERKAAGDKQADKDFRELKKETEAAIRENRLERIGAYGELITKLGGKLGESAQRAQDWIEQDKERAREIQHNANSDLEGVSASEFSRETWKQRSANWAPVRFFMKPLGTFDMMLRFFGSKSVDGRGYLWNRFMTGWVEANDKEWRNLRAAHDQLDAKVREVFGKKMRWSDLFTLERKMEGMEVEFWDAGEKKAHTLTQGNMLYIYAVNKMSDGRMKLRKMGITEEDVELITEKIDPRFIALADWVQDVFLKDKRKDYNAVHLRMTGADMADIDNYFPLKVNKRSLSKEEDIGNSQEGEQKPATKSVSWIKRTKNARPLDIVNADFFDVLLEHLQDNEHIAAFAEFNRDINTLLSYKRFRNKVLNMSSLRYGSGKNLWNNFRRVCEIAAGVYTPKVDRDSIDTTIVNIAKGVTIGKISYRLYTAFKQLTSSPAFATEASPLALAKNNPFTGGVKAWNWAIQNLPGFSKRWQSRQAGDSRLLDTDSDWKFWHKKFVKTMNRWGMTPNALIDALTVACGAKAIYDTKYAKYKKMGYSDTKADKLALRDASISVNETQQSSEEAYLSAVQLDRTAASTAITVFRNASMGYERRYLDAMSNFGRKLKPGYRDMSIEFMKKQLMRDGLSEEQADKAAKQAYRRSWWKDVANMAMFGHIMQIAWNIAPYLPFLFLIGGDDDKKEEMVEDALLHSLFGPIEGLSLGAQGSEILNMGRHMLDADVKNWNDVKRQLGNYQFNLLPLMSDLQSVFKHFSNDYVQGLNDVVNLVVQSGIGVNPQTLTDIVASILDRCDGDPDLSREATIMWLRIANAPQTQLDQIYLEELGLKGSDAKKLSAGELADRYVRYKTKRSTPLTGWMYSDEAKQKAEDKYMRKFVELMDERIAGLDDKEMERAFDEGDALLRKEVGKAAAKKQGSQDYYGSPTTVYGEIYKQHRNYFDLSEDVLLQTEAKKAKDSGDMERYKEIDSGRRAITKLKKDLDGAPYTLQDGSVITVDDIMNDIREERMMLLEELGL